MRDNRRAGNVTDESGQVLMLAALFMAMLLVMVALVVDIGKAYLVQRQLQAGVDAAALAGAQHLPEPTEATVVAQQHGPSAGGKNEVTAGSNVTTTVTMRCVKSAPGCRPTLNNYNAVEVQASSDVSLLFARVIGIDKLEVNRARHPGPAPARTGDHPVRDLFNNYVTLTDAVRAGARQAAVSRDLPDPVLAASNRVKQSAAGLDAPPGAAARA